MRTVTHIVGFSDQGEEVPVPLTPKMQELIHLLAATNTKGDETYALRQVLTVGLHEGLCAMAEALSKSFKKEAMDHWKKQAGLL